MLPNLLLCLQQAPCGAALPPAPIAFVENAGQWDTALLYRTDCGRFSLGCEAGAIRLCLRAEDGRGVVLRWRFPGDDARPRPRGREARREARTYFREDGARGRSAAAWSEVEYPASSDGVALILRDGGGVVEYDLVLAAGSNPETFIISCEGSTGLRLDASGALVMETAVGPFRQSPPRSWQVQQDGSHVPVTSGFRIVGENAFCLVTERLDPTMPTVVDPGLEWANYVGGSVFDELSAVCATPQGEWIVAGATRSPDFPASAGAFDPDHNGGEDAVVAKYDASGSQLLWATYLGGPAKDSAWQVCADSAGRPLVLGSTASPGFPTTPGAWDRILDGAEDAFIARLSTDGATLEWSTLLGGMFGDEVENMALTAADEPVVVGGTDSPDYPVVGSAAQAMSGAPGYDAVVTRLSADGSTLLMSTCIFGAPGPNWEDFAGHVAILPGGASAVIAGDTNDPAFPVAAGTLGASYSGNQDGFLAVVDLTTGAVGPSTFVGGSGEDNPHALAVAPSGDVWLLTTTDSADFPMPAIGYDLLYDDRGDLALTVLDSALAGSGPQVPLAGTFLGTLGDEEEGQMVLAPDGSVIVAGSTNAPSFPTMPGAWDTVHNGVLGLDDVFVSRLDASCTALLYSTFLGGTGVDLPSGMILAGPDQVVLCGNTNSVNFPMRVGAHDTSFNGQADGFFLKLDLRPCPILEVQPAALLRGQSASWRITELAPGERVFVAAGLAGTGFGMAPPPLGGMNLDLAGAPFLLGQTPPADASGTAILRLIVPAGAPATTAWFQAAVQRGVAGSHSLKSNVVARDVR